MSRPRISRIARGMLSRQWVTVGLAILLIAISLTLAWQNERMAIAEQTRQLRVQSEILAAGVASSLAFDDTQTAQEYLEAFRRNRDIRAAAIYDARGARVMAFASGIGSPARVRHATLTLARGELTVVTPVTEGDLFLG